MDVPLREYDAGIDNLGIPTSTRKVDSESPDSAG